MLPTLLMAPLLSLLSGSPQMPESLSRPDLPVLIECRGQVADFLPLGPVMEQPLLAVSWGWQPLPQTNMFLTEFRLTAPIHVFGHATDHIAFTGDSVLAILDLPDPRPLAAQLELETAIDTPEKAMFGKELQSTEKRYPGLDFDLIESIVLNVSNVASHPGKTLVGCSYSVDMPEEETPADGDEPTPPPESA